MTTWPVLCNIMEGKHLTYRFIPHQINLRYPEDIFSICAVMTDETLGDPVDRLAAVNEIMLEMSGEECVDHTYDAFLQDLTNTNWAAGGIGWRQWSWQTCTEFGWYQTTNQVSPALSGLPWPFLSPAPTGEFCLRQLTAVGLL